MGELVRWRGRSVFLEIRPQGRVVLLLMDRPGVCLGGLRLFGFPNLLELRLHCHANFVSA